MKLILITLLLFAEFLFSFTEAKDDQSKFMCSFLIDLEDTKLKNEMPSIKEIFNHILTKNDSIKKLHEDYKRLAQLESRSEPVAHVNDITITSLARSNGFQPKINSSVIQEYKLVILYVNFRTTQHHRSIEGNGYYIIFEYDFTRQFYNESEAKSGKNTLEIGVLKADKKIDLIEFISTDQIEARMDVALEKLLAKG
jgi:hypothetical protein